MNKSFWTTPKGHGLYFTSENDSWEDLQAITPSTALVNSHQRLGCQTYWQSQKLLGYGHTSVPSMWDPQSITCIDIIFIYISSNKNTEVGVILFCLCICVYVWCVSVCMHTSCVWVWSLSCHVVHLEIKEQLKVFNFQLVWNKVSLMFSIVYVSLERTLVLQTYAINFTWALWIWTQVLTLTWKYFYTRDISRNLDISILSSFNLIP